ncbi:hypothetical protein B0H11DRAFT_2271101, partial [Mycena galericulata]
HTLFLLFPLISPLQSCPLWLTTARFALFWVFTIPHVSGPPRHLTDVALNSSRTSICPHRPLRVVCFFRDLLFHTLY